MIPFSKEDHELLKEMVMTEYLLRLEGLVSGSPIRISRLMKNLESLIREAKIKGIIPITTTDILSDCREYNIRRT